VGLARDDDIIVTMDSDNTHTPALIADMVRGVREGYDVVIASRFRSGARILGVPLYRRLLSRCASWAFRLAFPTRGVRDFTSGYRAYRAGLLVRAFDTYGEQFVAESGFACTVDILLKLRSLGARMHELPLVLRYDFKYSISKMYVMRTLSETLRLLVARRLGA
jgi:dolichol-phosphate mannosyltransferase